MSSKPLPSFLQHVVDILETSESSASPCARWSDDGLSFVVLDTKRFSSEFLALHFKSAQFSSFVRQLNFYGKCSHSLPRAPAFACCSAALAHAWASPGTCAASLRGHAGAHGRAHAT